MKNLFLMSSLFISFFLSLSTPLSAQEKDDKDWTLDPKTSTLIPKYLGKIKVLKGKAIIGDRELKKGSKIYNNDLIQTMENSFIVMEMIDLTTITLGPVSEFKVANWTYRTKNDRTAEFSVLKGQWRALVRSKSKDDDQLKIRTPLVSLGIRGTELMVNVIKEKDSEVTQVALLEGSVHMETADGKIQEMVPGDHALVQRDGPSVQRRDKKMNEQEMKSYQEYTSPGVLKLLPHEKIILEAKASLPELKTSGNAPNTTTTIVKQGPKDKTVQENLKILNTVREENRKKK